MIVMQSTERCAYLLRIARRVYPELVSAKFFASVNGVEHYFSGLQEAKVKMIYRSFYDEFDFAFSIHCRFSLCDRKTGTRWIRQGGNSHIYIAPSLFVLERDDFNYSPAGVADRMHGRYRANTLVLGSYVHPDYSVNFLASYLRRNGLHFILKDELTKIISPADPPVVDMCC